MPAVTITLSDTPDGGVEVTSNYAPTPGQACSPAQVASLDIINRTKRHWNLVGTPGRGVDIDAAHRTHNKVANLGEVR